MMKNVNYLMLLGLVLSFIMSSCSTSKSTMSKNAVSFPGMTVSRADYKLSEDVSSTVKVNETSVLGLFRFAKIEGEDKRVVREGHVGGYKLDPASKLAVYRVLDKHQEFDYLTNIRVKKEFNRKWMLFFTKYTTDVTVTAKGITLKTEK